MAISYRTIQDPGKRLRAEDKSMQAAGAGFAQGYATMAAVQAQISAKREMAKREQQAKDTWRDSQMAGITDTTFVEKVHSSIGESAYGWLKEKQQRYAQLTDMLMQEGMNSRNEQWAGIQNERKSIEGAYNNFSKNLEAFKTARQTTAEMRGTDIEGGEYNEVAKTPNSEAALGFLYDREFGQGYGDIEIADDGSFTFPETEWQGGVIGSGNLPTVVDMPYKQQQALQKRELMYGQEIKSKAFEYGDKSNNARIRNEIHQEFRGMGVGELQAYILNDMDGEGGTPAFIGQLAPGENPEFTWKDHQGNEQKMLHNDLLQNKDAMISFATANEYQGTLDYMKGMVPDTGDDNSLGTQTGQDLTKLIEGSVIEGSSVPVGYNTYEEFENDPKFKNDKERNAYLNKVGVKREADREQSTINAAQRIVSSKYNNQNLKTYPYSKMVTRDKAFELFEANFYETAEYEVMQPGTTKKVIGIGGDDVVKAEDSNREMREKAIAAFNEEYPLSSGNRIFNYQTINNGKTPIISGTNVDPTDPGAMMEFLQMNNYLTEDKVNMLENISSNVSSGSVLD